ncbi:hypothetical protein BDR06DRAFT_982936 [Suillus hirtellus]|nr:hypothetical protein BDR06DRAFT_982936 [Suillus hirtellus]
MYQHNITRFNYTTYDVRRAQDVINPRTSHCNVMVLHSDNTMGCKGHRYIYGNVLGVYHVNVIFIGHGMVDYTPIRMEFLWIHWYESMDQYSTLHFLPLVDEHSFNFLDPADVLQGCHIIPHFAHGRRHDDGLGLSACVGDKEDWHEYYINW